MIPETRQCKFCDSQGVVILWSPYVQRYCLNCDMSWEDNELSETAARVWDEVWKRLQRKHDPSPDDSPLDD